MNKIIEIAATFATEDLTSRIEQHRFEIRRLVKSRRAVRSIVRQMRADEKAVENRLRNIRVYGVNEKPPKHR